MRLSSQAIAAPIAAAFFCLVAVPADAQLKPATQIVPQTESPVTITSYTAEYRERSGTYVSEGVHHEVAYENKGTKPIVAIQISLIEFDIWNEYLDRLNGISTSIALPAKPTKGRWVNNSYRAFSFLTGVAYVNRVRFNDGTIWTADTAAVLSELQKIEKDFDPARLKKEPDPPKVPPQ